MTTDILIEFTDWSNLKKQLDSISFTNEQDLIEQMNLNYETYQTIVHNMIHNWKDSVSKSLLHSVSNAYNQIPKPNTKIFNNIYDQTRALLVMSNGSSTRNMFGETNSVYGLRLISFFSLTKIKEGNFDLLTTDNPQTIEQINSIIQYVWLYVFLQKKLKAPKYLYRGIRLNTLYDSKPIKELLENFPKIENEKWYQTHARRMDLIIKYILEKGVDNIMPGKFLSFTSSQSIAKYFANQEGFLLRVESNKVNIITSELTEPLLAEKDYVSGKSEKEYIVNIPDGYQFTKDDIIISDLNWYMTNNNPLCVPYFDHNDKLTQYEMNNITVLAYYVWNSNTSGSVRFRSVTDDSYGMSRKEFKTTYGFDPMPTENNLDQIKNFQLIEVKNRY